MPHSRIFIYETPRDAMQGWPVPISTPEKVAYIGQLLHCGFHGVDVGSFVSPTAVPQMADTSQVIGSLPGSDSKLSVVVGNLRGCRQALSHARVDGLAYPHSISATFLARNLHSDPLASWQMVQEMNNLCKQHGKTFLPYISMAFGNPYGDIWNTALLQQEVVRMIQEGISEIALSDITALADEELIYQISHSLKNSFPDVTFRLHLHVKPGEATSKIQAAIQAGIRHFESATGGVGGCPLTGYELVQNLDTAQLVAYCQQHSMDCGIAQQPFAKAREMAAALFGKHADGSLKAL